MNLNKHMHFFNPQTDLKQPIHIIGCGAIGSTIAEMLTRLGILDIHLYDFDKVSPHNITNQMFRDSDIGTAKVDALFDILTDINPNWAQKIKRYPKGWTPGTRLSGIVILAVDNIDLRRQIVKENMLNQNIELFMDFRMGMTDAQHYAANWGISRQREGFLDTMAFSHDEAKANTPVSPCGTSLNVTPTPRMIVSLGVANLLNYLKDSGNLKKLILADAFTFDVTAM